MAMKNAGALCCSFCGKSQKDVKKLIAGPSVQICHECVAICVEIINDDAQGEAAATATGEGKGKKKEKKKVPKKGAASTVKKQPRRTKSAHSFPV